MGVGDMHYKIYLIPYMFASLAYLNEDMAVNILQTSFPQNWNSMQFLFIHEDTVIQSFFGLFWHPLANPLV